MKKQLIFLFGLIVVFASFSCSKESEKADTVAEKSKPIKIEDVLKIPSNPTFDQTIANWPELELPFPVLEFGDDGYGRFPRWPIEMDPYKYQDIHPELRITPSIAISHFHLETPRLEKFAQEKERFRFTVVGKVTRENFYVLIYHVAKLAGTIDRKLPDGTVIEDSTWLSEFRLVTRSKVGRPLASHNFGFENSVDYEDNGCAELLPDLTANVYDNPDCLPKRGERGCRIDYHVTIEDDWGQMTVKTKKY